MEVKRRTTRKRRPKLLRSSYGVVILPKGTKLYHISFDKLCTLSDKSDRPLLFTTLHPSEWYMEDTHVSVIELQRDVTLLFMVKMIHKLRVISALNDYLGVPCSNLLKQNCNKIKKWMPFLQKENLDGWFSSIENRSAVEFAIINNPYVLKIIDCIPIRFNWNNSSLRSDFTVVPKQWGTTYPISSLKIPLKFILNSRFKPMIDTYKKEIMEDPGSTAFSIILENADISYFDAPVNSILWA